MDSAAAGAGSLAVDQTGSPLLHLETRLAIWGFTRNRSPALPGCLGSLEVE